MKGRAVAGVVVVGIAAALSGCAKPLDENECAQLLDHYTEKVIDQARPSAKPSERAKWVAEARQKAARDPEFAACTSRVRRDQYECALNANNADEVERCLM